MHPTKHICKRCSFQQRTQVNILTVMFSSAQQSIGCSDILSRLNFKQARMLSARVRVCAQLPFFFSWLFEEDLQRSPIRYLPSYV